MAIQDFPGGTIVKDLIASARDMGLIPDPERFHMPQPLALAGRFFTTEPPG